jgi:hypothetical protein
MKRIWIAVLTILAVGLISKNWADDAPAAEGPAAKPVTVTGTLVDVMCYLEEGVTGNDHDGMKTCGTECLKGGSPAGILAGKKLYTLAFPAPAFKDYVGQTLEIQGKLYLNDQLLPRKVFVVKDGQKTEVSIKGKSMM